MSKYYSWLLGATITICVLAIGIPLVSFLWYKIPTAHRLQAQELVWSGAGGDGKWENPDNWNTKTVPTVLDIVTIDNATVTVSAGQEASFDTLFIGMGGITNVILEGNIGRAKDIHIGSHGFLVQKNNHEQIISGTLYVHGGGVVTHAPNMTTVEFAVRFSAQDIQIDQGGEVRVDGLGYAPGGTGPGAGASSLDGAGGGGHGGNGGDGVVGAGGLAYCSPDQEMQMGSGGGNGSPESSGAGGGLITLKAAHELLINGTINARGYEGVSSNAGGGAGGGVVLTAPVISGAPQEINVTGGMGNARGGGGAGGCVNINYVDASSITETMIHKEGGTAMMGLPGENPLSSAPQTNTGITGNSSSSPIDNSNLATSSSKAPQTTFSDTSSTPPSSDSSVAPLPSLAIHGNQGGEGKVFITQITASSPELPTIPVFVTSSMSAGNSSSTLTAFPMEVSATLYTVEQALEHDPYIVVSSTKILPSSYTFDNLVSDTSYAFRVRYGNAIVATSSFDTTSSSLKYVWKFSDVVLSLPDALQLNTATTTVSSTKKIASTNLPVLQILNPNSQVSIKDLPSIDEFYPGSLINYSYSYHNTLGDKQRFKVVRQIINEQTNKVEVNKESPLTLRSDQVFSFKVSERMPASLEAGVYIARVLIVNSDGKQIDGNGFRLVVQEK